MTEEFNLSGFALIGDMTHKEIMGEILDHQRVSLERMEPDDAKMMLIQIRMAKYQRRLMEEAQFGNGGQPIQFWNGGHG